MSPNVLDTSYTFDTGGVTYSFTTSLGDILTRVPMAAWYLDFVKKSNLATNPVIANRFPPPPIPASLEGSVYEPFELESGDVLTVGTPIGASLESAIAEPYNLSDGDTLELRIDGGYTQEFVLSGLTAGAATAEEVARSIHATIRKARAAISSSETKVTIYSKSLGEDSQVYVSGGTAAAILGFDTNPITGPVFGADGEESVEFDAVAAKVDSGNTAAFDLDDGDTLDVKVDGGVTQTITFSIDQFADIDVALVGEIIAVINDQLNGATASGAEGDSKVRISSHTLGTGSSIQVTGGTANAAGKLNFPTSIETGSGDFVDLWQATAVEVRDYLNASLTLSEASIAAEGLRVRITTAARERVICSGSAALALGIASSGRVTSSNAEPFRITKGQTIKVKVDGGPEQTIVLTPHGTLNTQDLAAEAVVDLLNFYLSGATAYTSEDGTKVAIVSNSTTTPSTVEVTGGSANPEMAFPENSEGSGVGISDLSVSEAGADEDIDLMLFDITSSGFDWVKIWVKGNFERKLIWDSALAFTEPGWTVTESKSPSPGSGVDDTWSISLAHSTDFTSDELMYVEVEAETLGADSLSTVYYFVVEDVRQPTVVKITVRQPDVLRVRFSEPMNQIASDSSSSLYTRDVSGRISYYETINVGGTDYDNVVEAPVASFATTDVGAFLGSAGARNSQNNGCWEILQRISTTMVQVDAELVDEEPADPQSETPPSVYVSPYRINRVDPPAGTIQPSFQPIVIDATAVASSAIPTGDEVGRYVDLQLHDALSPELTYQLELVLIEDPAGNLIGSTYTFTSWSPYDVEGREFELWEMLPLKNRDEDKTGDLERFVKCFDEATKVILYDIDRFGRLLDPWACQDEAVDPLLEHLGNPLAFVSSLTLDRKRDLIPILVPMYKQRGTAEGIEDAVQFFLNKTVVVKPWNIPADTWVLGESLLGYNTYVGPSQSFVRYSFFLEHTVTLTDSDKSIIKEIVEFIRPAHTHFVGFQLV
jgi:phage tail-like protein